MTFSQQFVLVLDSLLQFFATLRIYLRVIPCQTTGKKLEPQKNVILVLISFTFIQKYQIRSFISILLDLVCHFGQILSFEAFDIFFKDMSIFLSKKDLLPILFNQ